MVFCMKCGRYASGKGDKLNQLCPGQPGRKATLNRLLEARHPEKGHMLGEVTLLSVARTFVGLAETSQEEGRDTSSLPPRATADPMQELRELEEALERFQVEGEAGPAEEGWANDEEWEMLSSGSD